MTNPEVGRRGFKSRDRRRLSSQSLSLCISDMDTRTAVLLCLVAVSFVAAASSSDSRDLKTAESSRFFSWSGGNRYPPYPSYPNSWYQGNGYYYPNYFHQYNPGLGSGYPNVNYPNYGYNGYPGGYGFQSGFGGGFNPGYGGYNSRYRNQDITQQTTARGGYIYKR